MKLFRCSLVSVSLVFAVPLFASAQEGRFKKDREQEHTGLIDRIVHLMPPGYAARLDLTAEQQKKIQALQEDLKQKRRQILAKTVFSVVSMMDKLGDEKEAEPAPVLAVVHEVTGSLLEMRRMRIGYEEKMLAFLNEEQKLQFAELKERPWLARREEWDRGIGKSRGLDAGLLSPRMQQELKLDSKQREQIQEVRQELEAKLRSILTKEQQRQYDQLRQGRPRPEKERD